MNISLLLQHRIKCVLFIYSTVLFIKPYRNPVPWTRFYEMVVSISPHLPVMTAIFGMTHIFLLFPVTCGFSCNDMKVGVCTDRDDCSARG